MVRAAKPAAGPGNVGLCCKSAAGTSPNLLSEGVPDTELNYACGNIDDPSKIWPRCYWSTERRVRRRRVRVFPPDGVVIREVRRVKDVEAFRDDLDFPILADAEVSRDAEIIVQIRITPECIAPDTERTIRSSLAIAVGILSGRDVVEHTRTKSCDWRQAEIPENFSQQRFILRQDEDAAETEKVT